VDTFTFTDHVTGTTKINEDIAQLLRRISTVGQPSDVLNTYRGYHWQPEQGRASGILELKAATVIINDSFADMIDAQYK